MQVVKHLAQARRLEESLVHLLAGFLETQKIKSKLMKCRTSTSKTKIDGRNTGNLLFPVKTLWQ